jgi:hypothetical protein
LIITRIALFLALLFIYPSTHAQIALDGRAPRQSDPPGSPFAPVVAYDSGALNPYSIVVADVNGDGKPDVILAEQCPASDGCSSGEDGVIGVLLGNGDGTFQSALTFDAGGLFDNLSGPQAIAVADVNGDGRPDVLVATNCFGSDCGSGGVSVLLGNGDGTFQAALNYASGGLGATSVSVVDMNGDGKLDLVVLNDSIAYLTASAIADCSSKCGGISVLPGNGDGTFQPATTPSYSGGTNPLSVAIGDVNGDGKLDVVVTNSGVSSIGVLLGNGNGTFQPVVAYGSVGGGSGIALADVNGDGFLDAITSSVLVFLNNGNGTFQSGISYPVKNDPASVAVGDISGGGKLDLVVASGYPTDSAVSVLQGKGNGQFGNAVAYKPGGKVSQSVAVYDVNGDGLLDVLVANGQQLSGGNLDGAVGVLLHLEGPVPTTTTITSSPNPSYYGQTEVFTATVTASTGPPPDGELVTFRLAHGSELGTGNLTGGVAVFSDSLHQFQGGRFPQVEAVYGGDLKFQQSQSQPLTQTVEPDPTTTVVSSSVNPSSFAQSITFTAAVTPQFPAEGIKGSVLFYDGSELLKTLPLGAPYTTSALPEGSNIITAEFSPDPGCTPDCEPFFATSTSGPLTQIVNPSLTTTTLTSLPNPSKSGRAVTLTAKVSAQFGKAQGPVAFVFGSTLLGTVNLNSGSKAKLVVSTLPVGADTITANYSGSVDFVASSGSVVQTVQQ